MTDTAQNATVNKAAKQAAGKAAGRAFVAPSILSEGVMRGMTRLLVLLFGAIVLAALLWRALHAPVFTISRVDVEGETVHVTEAGLRAQVFPKLRGNFFTMRLDQAREVFQSQPWVKQAVVRRMFPNKLVVQLQEHQEVAYWGSEESNYRLLSDEGIVFDANPDEAVRDNLPTMNGPDDAAAQVLDAYHRLNPLFAPIHGRIAHISVDDMGSWSVTLDQDMQLALGSVSEDELARRVQQFVKTIEPIAARYNKSVSDVVYADLRYRSGYALRLKGLTTVSVADSGSATRVASASGRR